MSYNRRKFVRDAALTSAGLAILPSCGGAQNTGEQATSTPASPNVEPDIGIQLYTVRKPMNEDLEATIKAVADIGYRHVEVFGYGDRSYFGMPASDFYTMVKGYGLEIRSSHHGTGIINGESQGSLTSGWELAVEDAVSAGQRYMVCPYLVAEERTKEHYMALPEILNRAGQVCKDAGIQFAYHNHDFEFVAIDDFMPMDHILENTDPDLVKMELDLFWVTYAGQDPLAFFNKYPGRSALWHVKDINNMEDKDFTEVGNGIIDFKTIFQNADQAGMESFFVEQDQSDDPMASIATSYTNLKAILAEVG